MKDAQKPDHLSLNVLVSRIKEGRFAVPNFQRDFEWMPWDIQELMKSIFLDYYIGSLLLWKGKKENFSALACEDLYGLQDVRNWEYIVLDGQQRLTAIHYAFMAPDIPLPNRTNPFVYFIYVDRFMKEEYDSAFGYDWMKKRLESLIADPTEQFKNHIFPLSVIGQGGWSTYEWVNGYKAHWKNESKIRLESGDSAGSDAATACVAFGEKFGKHVREVIEQYQVSYVELDRDLELGKVCDIFTQINSRGVRLDVFDLINALLTPKGLEIRRMWKEASSRLSFIESERLNVYLLQVMSIQKQAYCSPKYLYYLMPGQEKKVRLPDGSIQKEILVKTTEEFTELWNGSVNALEEAIQLLRHPQEYGAIKSSFLPYVSILPCFAALRSHVRSLPAEQRLSAQRKVRQWYWSSVLLNRYSGSVESTAARDFLDIKAWISDDLSEPSLIREFAERHRQLDLRKEVKRGTSIYNGMFNLMILQGARDWVDGTAPSGLDLDDHHIVPASWGKLNGVGDSINSILNRTPLTAETNRKVISDRLPNEYLPEIIARNGRKYVETMLESHSISVASLDILLRSPFSPADFDEFLVERQRSFLHSIEGLLIKSRLDLPANLRGLDQAVEEIELGIRSLVSGILGQEPSKLPDYVKARIEERLNRALKRNPAMEAEYYRTLSGILEYADLRELQDIIVSAKWWSAFEPIFSTKESLSFRFNQLAELRNGIRHSRSVDEISQKDGEASIEWFRRSLTRAEALSES